MLRYVPEIDVVDDTFVVAAPVAVASVVHDEVRWRRWWPSLQLTTTRDRGLKGRQWAVRGALTGSAEIWLEPWADGVVVHFYLRADVVAPAGQRTSRLGASAPWAQDWKRQVHALKDVLEAWRAVGEQRPAGPGQHVPRLGRQPPVLQPGGAGADPDGDGHRPD